jgi:hypothetical protein
MKLRRRRSEDHHTNYTLPYHSAGALRTMVNPLLSHAMTGLNYIPPSDMVMFVTS